MQERPALFEIWTRRSVYRLDAELHCIQVADRTTGLEHTEYRCLGARLGGGRQLQGHDVTITFPLPVPGARALFQELDGGEERALLTGTVERVVVQTQRVTLEQRVQRM